MMKNERETDLRNLDAAVRAALRDPCARCRLSGAASAVWLARRHEQVGTDWRKAALLAVGLAGLAALAAGVTIGLMVTNGEQEEVKAEVRPPAIGTVVVEPRTSDDGVLQEGEETMTNGIRKLAAAALLSAGLSAASSGATFGDVIVRQMWPWQKDVTVDFTVTGVTGPSEVDVALTENGSELGEVPASAFTSSRAFMRGGKMRVTFDPAKVPALADRSRVNGVGVSLSSKSIAGDEILYAIFDLEHPGKTELVTREALTNGVWGAWEETIWPNVTTVKTPVWTGVTNDTKYALTHLVMRRIDAGSFNFGFAATADVHKGADWNNYTQRVVRITKPYYIGVYEFTAKQLRILSGSTNQNHLMWPTRTDSFDQIRGAYTTAGGAYDWPTDKTVDPDSYIGRLRARTGVAFDLPTDAQWEKAARAGSDGVYYDGCTETHKAERHAIAWCNSNIGEAYGDPRNVGLLKPNNYGLYDTLGNVWEWVLDWRESGSFDYSGDDPLGPTQAGSSFWNGSTPKRALRGASYGDDYNRITLHEHTQNPVTEAQRNYGWRVALPASEIDGFDEAVDVSDDGVCVDATPTATFHWATYASPHRTIEISWPTGAQSAKLTLAGKSGATSVVLAAGTESYDLDLARPQNIRDEDVLTLTLDLYSESAAGGTCLESRTYRGLGLIAERAAVAVSDSAMRRATGKFVTLPIQEGATDLVIGGESRTIGVGCCWYGWMEFSYNQLYGLVQSFDSETTADAEASISPLGLAILVR